MVHMDRDLLGGEGEVAGLVEHPGQVSRRPGLYLYCWGHGQALQKWCLGQVGLPQAGLVQLLEVDNPPGLAGLLGDNVHGRALYGGLANQLQPDDAHVGIYVKPLPCFLLPVDGQRPVFVDGEGPCLGVNEQLAQLALHDRQLLSLACVEG